MQVERSVFYKPEKIAKEVGEKVKKVRDEKEPIDYLTFVPDGEPTLDINLGREIDLLKPLGIQIAVITSASLIWREDVRDDLLKADWVSLKIDAISEDIWRRIDRPYKALKLRTILDGMLQFADVFGGELTTETMLVQKVNDKEEIRKIARFLAELKPDKAYIAIPTRPPAGKWVKPANEHAINMAYQIFSEKSIEVEYLIGYEGNAFAFTGNIEEDLLSITSVHPMRKESVRDLLQRANADWNIVEKLINEAKLLELEYRGRKFYARKLPSRRGVG